MYWFIFSDDFSMKCSLKTAKLRAQIVGCTYSVLCVTSKAEMEYL